MSANDHSIDSLRPTDEERPLSELLGRMTTDVGNLLTTQIELAKVEIKDEVSRAGKGVGMVGGGGLAAWFALLMVSFAVAYALSDAMDRLWAGFLVLTVVYAAIAAALIASGRARIADAPPIGHETVETIKEDLEWARQQRS